MVINYTVLSEVLSDINEGKKTVEIRFVNEKKPQPGDYILFKEWHGDNKAIVIVDEVKYYDSFKDIEREVPIQLWAFEPKEKFDELIQNEFRNNQDDKQCMAISFHIPEISIIMPAWNVEKYLEETLDTLEQQIFKDYELIVVDDCSDDNTPQILENYSRKLPIVILKNEHKCGAAVSRNRGLDYSKGKYVIFLDGDDLFEPEFLHELYNALVSKNADVAIVEFDSFMSDEGHVFPKQPAWINPFIVRASKNVFSWYDVPELLFHWTNVPWNKLIKKQLVTDNQLRFQDLTSSNDVYFGHIVCALGKMIHTASSDALVHYRVGRPGSISKGSGYANVKEAYRYSFGEFKGRGLLIDKLKDDFVYAIMRCIRFAEGNERREIIEDIKCNILSKNNSWDEEGYIISKYPLMQQLVNTKKYTDPIWNNNFEIINKIEKCADNIRQYLHVNSIDKRIGFVQLRRNERYFIEFFKDLNIDWIVCENTLKSENILINENESEDNAQTAPDIIVCLSSMYLTEYKDFFDKHGISPIIMSVFAYD